MDIFYSSEVYIVYSYEAHSGCSDNWNNMYEEDTIAAFETQEMAEEYIYGLAVKGHKVITPNDNRTVFVITDVTDDVKKLSELQKMAYGTDYYDESGWKIKQIDLYSEQIPFYELT